MSGERLIRSGSIEVDPQDWGAAWTRHHRAIVLRPRPWWCPRWIWDRVVDRVVRDKTWTERGIPSTQPGAALQYDPSARYIDAFGDLSGLGPDIFGHRVAEAQRQAYEIETARRQYEECMRRVEAQWRRVDEATRGLFGGAFP